MRNKQLTEMTGETSYTTEMLGNYPPYALEIYGKSTQGYASCGGTPLGKNLLSLNQNYEISTPQSICSNLPITLQEGTTYTFSYVSSSFISNSSINTTLTYNDGTSGFLSTLNIQQGLNSFDFTCAKPVTKISLYANVSTATTFSNLQIELGSTATSYEPYYSNPNPDCPVPIESVGDDRAVEVASCGKNLLPFAISETKTDKGITVVSNGDGSYHISGTATSGVTINFSLITAIVLPQETIYLSMNNSAVALNQASITFMKGSTQITYAAFNEINRKLTLPSLSGQMVNKLQFYVRSGATVDITCKPQLEINNYTDFEPYTGHTAATITSGMPLCSIGDVRDELIYNADGTGKIIKRVIPKRIMADTLLHNDGWVDGGWVIANFFDNAENILGYETKAKLLCTHATTNAPSTLLTNVTSRGVSQGGGINLYFNFGSEYNSEELIKEFLNGNEVYVYYPLATPQEIELSAAEMALLQQLQTFEGVTNLYNNGNGEMYVRAMTAGFEYGHEVGFFDSKI